MTHVTEITLTIHNSVNINTSLCKTLQIDHKIQNIMNIFIIITRSLTFYAFPTNGLFSLS